MRIALIASGAGGMYCGSCLRDNALARALAGLGHEARLVPTYTPLRTDEPDASIGEVFYGGVNVYLQQHFALFRHTPRWLDWVLDRKALLRLATRGAGDADPRTLVDLTLSMLAGEFGRQRKELGRLARFLRAFRPDVVNLPNELMIGLARRLRDECGAPVVCTLSGGDLFVDAMDEPDRARVKRAIRERASDVAVFIATSRFYADYVAGYYDLPREKLRVVPSGIDTTGYDRTPVAERGGPPAIGYLARICPAKGLHNLADAFVRLVRRGDVPPARLRVAGYLPAGEVGYLDGVRKRLTDAGAADRWEYVGELTHAKKVSFLRSLDLFSVPTQFLEPKGIYVLEALAAGVPVVQPRHGAFPEIVESTGGGVLVEPRDAGALADALAELLNDAPRRTELARRGAAAVHAGWTSTAMARATVSVYDEICGGCRDPVPGA